MIILSLIQISVSLYLGDVFTMLILKLNIQSEASEAGPSSVAALMRFVKESSPRQRTNCAIFILNFFSLYLQVGDSNTSIQ